MQGELDLTFDYYTFIHWHSLDEDTFILLMKYESYVPKLREICSEKDLAQRLTMTLTSALETWFKVCILDMCTCDISYM